MKPSIEEIARLSRRYKPRAIYFVHTGLAHAVKRYQSPEEYENKPSHVTGRQLCLGLADLASQKWGRLAMVVLNHYGMNTTRDFGEIVYLLIEYGWMSAQPQDTIEDFDDVYDFEEMFETKFKFSRN